MNGPTDTALTTPGGGPSPRLSWAAIWRAAITTGTFALPLAIGQSWLIDNEEIAKSDPVNFLLYLAIMFCGALGGFTAAKLATSLPLQNGAAAAASAAMVIQLGGALRRSVAGEEISSPIGWVFLALLMATMGMFGAWVFIKTDPEETHR